ncbi:MAG: GNAT family N-acetyltransferase [Planctomycetaceae bacterium]|nr:GNAT family N-acetyltransferase [Planctomycetaceae bacterium]
MTIRPLIASDAEAFQTLRLSALLSAPTAFASSHAEELPRTIDEIARRIDSDQHGRSFGAFDGVELVGMVHVARETRTKLAHKAWLGGVYVAPESRHCGIGRRLVSAAMAFAFGNLGVRQINLGVNSRNQPAIALYESLGFRTFGLERDFLCVDGVFYDELHMTCSQADFCQ